MSDVVKRKVAEAINKSGYPLELFVSANLESKKHIPWHNDYYFDYDEGKARTIDMAVSPINFPSKSSVDVSLAIECKKSAERAWVFFPAKSMTQPESVGQIIDYAHIATSNYEQKTVLWKFDDNLPLHYGKLNEFSSIAHSYQVVKIGQNNFEDDASRKKTKDDIFEALNQTEIYYLSP